jgi:hypothetical protein
MSKAEPGIGVAQYKEISRQYDNHHLRRPTQGTRPYPEIPSRPLIQVLIMVFGKIVNPTSKQSDNLIARARCYFYTSSFRASILSRSSDPVGRLLALYDGQLDSLSVLKSDFAERFKNTVFVKSIDGLCHR